MDRLRCFPQMPASPSQQNIKHVLLSLNLWPEFHMMKSMSGALLCSVGWKPADVNVIKRSYPADHLSSDCAHDQTPSQEHCRNSWSPFCYGRILHDDFWGLCWKMPFPDMGDPVACHTEVRSRVMSHRDRRTHDQRISFTLHSYHYSTKQVCCLLAAIPVPTFQTLNSNGQISLAYISIGTPDTSHI